MTPVATHRSAAGLPPSDALDVRIMRTGDELMSGLTKVLKFVPGNDAGPQRLATELGVDTVLASRLLKAVRSPDSMSMIHRTPGPEPLRRVLKASAKHGVPADVLAAAHEAVDAFENLIDSAAGDRSSLEAILSAWVPEARREFELRRKQAAFRAISQLKGVQANVFAETAIFTPSADGQHCDVVWIKAVSGLSRLRPAAVVKFTSKRGVETPNTRLPVTLQGEPIDSVQNAVVPEFCTSPTPALTAQIVGEQTHYLLEGVKLGDSIQLMTCEVNRSEIARYVQTSRGRRAWSSSDLAIPAQRFQFDTIVHQDLFPGEHPDLRIYDTAIRGTADRNDPARDIDQFDLLETVEHLGTGLARFASSDVPRYRQMLEFICSKLAYDPMKLRGYRVASDYPLYGSQYAMSFRTTDPPADPNG
ncbi:MAG: hypothetical protein JNK16_09870 [Phycisphaerales bacterium]|nr:hypothetical protein [Phycisphaerales bacterium]